MFSIILPDNILFFYDCHNIIIVMYFIFNMLCIILY